MLVVEELHRDAVFSTTPKLIIFNQDLSNSWSSSLSFSIFNLASVHLGFILIQDPGQ